MFSRLPRALYNPTLSRIPRITTVLHYRKTQVSAPLLVRRCHSGRGGASLASALIPNDIKRNKPQHVAEATQLSKEDYSSLVEVYFEAVIEYTGHAQGEGFSITLEHRNDVITITAPGIGDYFLQRQHRTHQIWLYSPISGSKDYDWVVDGLKQYVDDGVTMGEWLHLSDGTNLSDVLNTELGLKMEMLFG
ncbi:hypothetical protein BKA66DRAFT_410359 [Pyrenochaeta sp. MPI-SDFR-AT-0127]|nr:hypothetical protein BKA66DRAFT_410359 [Pyrenochaeta sp. MPI-SDFR-AT-0127]